MPMILVLCTIISSLWPGQAQELKRYESTQALMGVQFTLIIYATDESSAATAIDEAFSEIEAMEKALSDYQPKSEINSLCQSAPHAHPVEVSEYLYETHALAKKIYEQTEGAFDISVGPATQLWRLSRRNKRLPTQEKIAEARSRMGLDCIQSQTNNQTFVMSITKANMQLDFGGIAKGRAADLAMLALKKRGIQSALINASGDILVSNPPPEKEGWTIQIPGGHGQETTTITLANSAVATSGDVYQFLEVDGVRYSHIIDPKTAEAISDSRIVTVIHENGGSADAYASAISVLGADGLLLAEEGEFEAQVITATNRELTQFEVRRTNGFPIASEEKGIGDCK